MLSNLCTFLLQAQELVDFIMAAKSKKHSLLVQLPILKILFISVFDSNAAYFTRRNKVTRELLILTGDYSLRFARA
jgi:hypothetical protein